MQRVRDIIGKPVLTFDTGRHIGDVQDVLFEPEENRVLALLIDRGGWFEDAKVVPFAEVKSIGRDAVIIPDTKAIISAKRSARIARALDSGKVIAGMEVFSSDGDYLGRIDNMLLDEETGEVKGYEVTGGLVEETLRGRKFLPAPETVEVGREVVFIPPETKERLAQEVTGGLERATGEARERGGEFLGRARKDIEKGAEEARLRGEEVMGRAREDITRASVEQQKRFAVGKRAGAAVVARDGTLVINQGEIITEPTVEEAERLGVLDRLVAAAGGEQIRGGGETLRREAASAFDDVRHTFEDLVGRTQRQTQEERIKNALGRPVTRVILDRQDRVILNTGEIITNRAIERAREAGVLDILLSSVYKGEPKFGIEEQRAPRSGEAGLEGSEPDRGRW